MFSYDAVGDCSADSAANENGRVDPGRFINGRLLRRAVPTNADSQTNGVSQWSLQMGFKYEF